MFLPVERSMTVSAPHLVAQRIFSTSSSMRGGDGAVADVGVDLHEEVAADDHRLKLRVVDVRGDDGAARGDFGADELRRDLLGDALGELSEYGWKIGAGSRELGGTRMLLLQVIPDDVC